MIFNILYDYSHVSYKKYSQFSSLSSLTITLGSPRVGCSVGSTWTHRGGGARQRFSRVLSAGREEPAGAAWPACGVAVQSEPEKRETRSEEGSGSRPVSRVLSKAVIHLRRTSPYACSDLPGSGAGHASSPVGDALPYLVLLRVGFTLPPVSPPARCALTAPFHPYPVSSRTFAAYCAGSRRFVFCGTFRGLAPPRRYLAPCPAEPGLSSTSKFSKQRLPGRLPLDAV